MFLSDTDIKKGVEQGAIIIKPFVESQLQMASYDVTLGNEFEIVDRHQTEASDPANKVYPKTRKVTVPDGETFVLHPGENVLAKQKEFVGVDNEHLILLSGKSSLARIGLVVHNTAMLFNPGHKFYPTFELVNSSNVPIVLRPGMAIAQLIFGRLSSPVSKSYEDVGRFDSINSNHFAGAKIDMTGSADLPTPTDQSHQPDPKHPEYQYLNLCLDVMENGADKELFFNDVVLEEYKKRGEEPPHIRSVFGRQIRFDLSKGFPLLTTKKTFWRGITTELLWFLSGSSNLKPLLDQRNHIWDEWAWKRYHMWALEHAPGEDLTQEEFIQKITDLPAHDPFVEKWGDLITIYGRMWRRWPAKDGREIDQLQWVIDGLKKKPDRKSYVVNAWNPDFIYEMASEDQKSHVPPFCHTMYQFQVMDGKLNLGLYQRSADLFLGVPFNIASYALLLEMVAQVVDIPAGEFVHTFGDAHLYSNHFDQVKEQLTRVPYPFPTLELNPDIKHIDDFTLEDIKLNNYQAHPSLKAPIANIGGFDEKKKV